MAKNLLATFVPVTVLIAITATASLQIMRHAPAFSEELRTESVMGDWRLPTSRALYDESLYYFLLGFGYLRGDAASLLMGEDELPSFEVFTIRVERSVALFEASIAAAPGRVDAWTSLGWAHVLLGDTEAAVQALNVSWQLAPFNKSEASQRLALVEALDDLTDDTWRSNAATMRFVENDLRTLKAYDRRYFNYFKSYFNGIMEKS